MRMKIFLNYPCFTTKRLWSIHQMRLNMIVYVNDLPYFVWIIWLSSLLEMFSVFIYFSRWHLCHIWYVVSKICGLYHRGTSWRNIFGQKDDAIRKKIITRFLLVHNVSFWMIILTVLLQKWISLTISLI